jgi:UDP-N-acetylmuramoyl-L-alanyl-D-glutamate--2,6-diaminopimelate ligase
VSAASVSRRKRLSDCVGEDLGVAPMTDAQDVWITGVSTDSRKVRAGDLFIATRGAAHDGHDFIDVAIAKGAVAILSEHDAIRTSVPSVTAPDTRRIAGRVAARFYDHPSRTLGCIGVTGTNGKTSVSHFTAALLTASGLPSGYGGTLGWGFAGKNCSADLTTEDAVTLQRKLADLLAAGAEWVAMEASSHALDQERVTDVAFDIAVFTNLTRDHLDYHGTMDRYAAAKRRLFDWPTLQGGVVNWDDPQGRMIYRDRRAGVNLLRFGSTSDADLAWSDLAFDAGGINGTLTTPWGSRSFRLPLFGEFNVANFAAAAAAACLAGAALDDVIAGGAQLAAPAGRMQFVRATARPLVVIDFAHTPDALVKALAAVRRHSSGQIVCVFGCGGDRDRGKRPLMARAVEAGADRAWVTSDNPRSEAPADIAAQIVAGFQGRIAFDVELDRATAIERAIMSAGATDIVLVAGKGHEAYQEVAGHRIAYSDSEVAQRVLGIRPGAAS